jgi:hypothetical protein
LGLVENATDLRKRMAKIVGARIGALPAREIFDPAHGVAGAHRPARCQKR